MPSYHSKDGIWHPAKEHAVLPHLSGTDKEIYDGPDRAAMEELALSHGVDEHGKPKVTTFGTNFRNDPELINRARQLGYKDVMEYALAMGYDEKKSEESFMKHAASTEIHKEPTRKPESVIRGGGISTAPGNENFTGGFGDQKLRTESEIKK